MTDNRTAVGKGTPAVKSLPNPISHRDVAALACFRFAPDVNTYCDVDIVAVARIGSALSDVTRVAIFQLADGEHAIVEIARIVGVTPSAVSFHVRKLHDAGLVEVVRHGRWCTPTRTASASRMIAAFDGRT